MSRTLHDGKTTTKNLRILMISCCLFCERRWWVDEKIYLVTTFISVAGNAGRFGIFAEGKRRIIHAWQTAATPGPGKDGCGGDNTFCSPPPYPQIHIFNWWWGESALNGSSWLFINELGWYHVLQLKAEERIRDLYRAHFFILEDGGGASNGKFRAGFLTSFFARQSFFKP